MAKKGVVQIIKQFCLNIQTKKFLFFLTLILLLLSVFWPKRDLVQEWQEKKGIESEIAAWEKLLEKYPGHRDLYLNLAVLNWQISNEEKAKEHLKKAKELDPNFEKTKELEKLFQEE